MRRTSESEARRRDCGKAPDLNGNQLTGACACSYRVQEPLANVMPSSISQLLAELALEEQGAGAAWLKDTFGGLAAGHDRKRFHVAFARAGRKLGRHQLLLEAERLKALAKDGGPEPFLGWCADDIGRGALLA